MPAPTLDGITLPSDLLWTDEYRWTPVQQSESYAVDGTLVVQSGVRLAGRPITLAGGQDFAWAQKALVDALMAKLGTAPLVLTLLDGRQFNVIWRHGETPLEASPVIDYANPEADDWYVITLRFMTA